MQITFFFVPFKPISQKQNRIEQENDKLIIRFSDMKKVLSFLIVDEALYLNFMALSLLENSQGDEHNDKNLQYHFTIPSNNPDN